MLFDSRVRGSQNNNYFEMFVVLEGWGYGGEVEWGLTDLPIWFSYDVNSGCAHDKIIIIL